MTPVKSYLPRFVFLPEEGLQFFRRLAAGKGPEDPIFVRESGRLWFDNYKHPFKRAVMNAQLPKRFCFHGLRHTYASQLMQAGTPVIVIAEQLGHRNIETVSRTYGHMAPHRGLHAVQPLSMVRMAPSTAQRTADRALLCSGQSATIEWQLPAISKTPASHQY